MLFIPFLAIRTKERKEYTRMRLELQEMVEEFYQRFSLTYKQLRLKHRKQLERLKITETIHEKIPPSHLNGKIPPNQLNGTWV